MSSRGNESGLSSGPSQDELIELARLISAGRNAEAEPAARRMIETWPRHGVGWKALGAILAAQARLEAAMPALEKALELLPTDAQTHCTLGNTLQGLGRLSEAESSYRRAIELKPGYHEAFNNLGNILLELGRPAEAEANYRRAIELNPDFYIACNNLGNALQALGRSSEAEASYRRAIGLRPDLHELQNNLGAALMDLGRPAEAEASYRRALELKPDYHEAQVNLGVVLNAQGKRMMALNVARQCLRSKETREARDLFVDCVQHLWLTQAADPFRDAMVRALSEPWGRPAELVCAGADLVKAKPEIAQCVSRVIDAWPRRLPAEELFASVGLATVAADSLLSALLDAAPISDAGLERFLTMVRRTMLDAATNTTARAAVEPGVLDFYCALARQCFTNEYVYAWTDDEADRARALRDSLATAMETEGRIPALWPVAVAAYFPLCSLPIAARLLERSWPDSVAAVLTQQVREPAKEQQLRSTIPSLTAVTNAVSLRVQLQYEENPYPRWIKAAPAGKPVPIDLHLRRNFPLSTFRALGKTDKLSVLIAGCGTGQHPIETAQGIQGARVLAVDLSLASLCYAKRKTQDLGVTSIDYAQADILQLRRLDRSFDVIESSGVLHHLDDPMEGWRVLLSLLRPDGFMRIGLYSELARRDIVRARTFIAERNYGRTADDIRRCRQDLMNLGDSAGLEWVLKSGDFFTISACRDHLFHVQEHRMTLDRIEAFLRDNDLRFLGFNIDAQVVHAYRLRFPGDRAATDLGNWQVFENENPDTFRTMYQFWVQREG